MQSNEDPKITRNIYFFIYKQKMCLFNHEYVYIKVTVRNYITFFDNACIDI